VLSTGLGVVIAAVLGSLSAVGILSSRGRPGPGRVVTGIGVVARFSVGGFPRWTKSTGAAQLAPCRIG
jgi:hypothetical protein